MISYLGWVSAQISALGLVFHVVTNGEISQTLGMWLVACSVLIYTLYGGMWAVAMTDLIQMVVIVVGMLYIGHQISDQVGGVTMVIDDARQSGKFQFWPDFNGRAVIGFFTALITMLLGSIPQQDVFQRVQSSKNVTVAIWATVIGGCLYFIFAFIPIFIAYSANLINPGMVAEFMASDPQLILPKFVLHNSPVFAQITFFGALLSAIKSCASATLLAPSVTFTENILKPIYPNMTDRQLLQSMRIVTLGFALLVTLYATHSNAGIFKMVENAYQITLVVAFVPLVTGIYWPLANNTGAIWSIFCGVTIWLGVHSFGSAEPLISAQLAGVCASGLGMMLGSMFKHYSVKPV